MTNSTTTEVAQKPHCFEILRAGMQSSMMDVTGLWTYPALLRGKDGSILWLCLVSDAVPMAGKKRTAIFRPKAIVVAKSDTPEVVRFENLRHRRDPFQSVSWSEPIAMFPHKAVADLTLPQFKALERKLLDSYTDASAAFAKGVKLPARFRKLYLQLQNPVYLGFLKCLAPLFFASLNVEKKKKT